MLGYPSPSLEFSFLRPCSLLGNYILTQDGNSLSQAEGPSRTCTVSLLCLPELQPLTYNFWTFPSKDSQTQGFSLPMRKNIPPTWGSYFGPMIYPVISAKMWITPDCILSLILQMPLAAKSCQLSTSSPPPCQACILAHLCYCYSLLTGLLPLALPSLTHMHFILQTEWAF